MQESGLTEIVPLICSSALYASILCFLILSFLKMPQFGMVAVWWLLDGRHSLFPSWVPSGLTVGVTLILWLDHLFTIMAGNVLFIKNTLLWEKLAEQVFR